jgi:chemotaxis protein CheX
MDDQSLIQYIRAATVDVFGTMLGITMEPGEPRREQQGAAVSDGVFAFVGMAGNWVGSGTISCSAAFACRISSHLLMTESTSIDEDVLDAVGEVANMIIGNFKSNAEEIVGAMGLSIPTVIYGRNFTSRSLGRSDWIVQPFVCDEGELEVRVCLAPANRSHPTTPSAVVQAVSALS